jgi:hypothetical protein
VAAKLADEQLKVIRVPGGVRFGQTLAPEQVPYTLSPSLRRITKQRRKCFTKFFSVKNRNIVHYNGFKLAGPAHGTSATVRFREKYNS